MDWRSFVTAGPVAAGLLCLLALPGCATQGAGAGIRDDAALDRVVAGARQRFLANRPFDRLDVTVLLLTGDGTWLRASVGGSRPWYPASCVKLAIAVAAVQWCADRSRGPDCLDESVRPMLVDSDNVATGVVVDAVSGVANGPVEGADFDDWLARRLVTENLLRSHGLLGRQRLANKTYPTNSGEMPEGLEREAVARHGRNSMNADASARLMHAVVTGEFGWPAAAYLRSRLRRPLLSANSAMGGGFPAGTVYESKIGEAYDTLAEIVHAELPDGRRLIVAAYSNGRDPDGPDDQDQTVLEDFARLLLEGIDALEPKMPAR